MNIRIRFSFLLLFILAITITGCGGKKNTGVVGEKYTFSIDSAVETSDTEFKWTIIDQPLSSVLSPDDLEFSSNNTVMSFIPTYEGLYSFQLMTIQYGDTLSTRLYDVEIMQGESKPTQEDYVEDESWLDEPEEAIVQEEPLEPVLETPVQSAPVKTIEDPAPVDKKIENKIAQPKNETKIKKPKNTGPLPGSTIPTIKGKYTIQVSSWSTLERAEKEYSRLVQEGFDAYVQKAYFKENNQTWYRVRVGSYNDYDMASKVSKSVSDALKVQAWVDFVRQDQ